MKALWAKLCSNPKFVISWTFFAGAFGSELTQALQAGRFVFSTHSLESMAEAAATTTAIALIHLYLPQPPKSQ